MPHKPLIAITSTQDSDGMIRISHDYFNAIRQSGGIGAAIPYTCDKTQIGEICREFDGLILGGGGDIDPAFYGQTNLASKNICSFRDKFEFMLVKEMLKKQKPILGICRGAQVLNVYFGGTLKQDVTGHWLENAERSLHKVNTTAQSTFATIVDDSTFYTNSFHHQAVDALAPPLVCDAYTKECIEAFHHKGFSFCIGIQWHPEKLPDSRISKFMFDRLIKEALATR